MGWLDEDEIKEIISMVSIKELSEDALKEIKPLYLKHEKEQKKKNFDDRELFEDKFGGMIFQVAFPEAELQYNSDGSIIYEMNSDGSFNIHPNTGKKIPNYKNKPKLAENNQWYYWGINLPLLGKNLNKYFAPKIEMCGWAPIKAIVRGNIGVKYKHTTWNLQEHPDWKKSDCYTVSEKEYLEWCNEYYNEDLTLDQILAKKETYKERTINVWQLIQVIG